MESSVEFPLMHMVDFARWSGREPSNHAVGCHYGLGGGHREKLRILKLGVRATRQFPFALPLPSGLEFREIEFSRISETSFLSPGSHGSRVRAMSTRKPNLH
eukprot:1179784-Prorocentrum_minimum.AAC.9